MKPQGFSFLRKGLDSAFRKKNRDFTFEYTSLPYGSFYTRIQYTCVPASEGLITVPWGNAPLAVKCICCAGLYIFKRFEIFYEGYREI